MRNNSIFFLFLRIISWYFKELNSRYTASLQLLLLPTRQFNCKHWHNVGLSCFKTDSKNEVLFRSEDRRLSTVPQNYCSKMWLTYTQKRKQDSCGIRCSYISHAIIIFVYLFCLNSESISLISISKTSSEIDIPLMVKQMSFWQLYFPYCDWHEANSKPDTESFVEEPLPGNTQIILKYCATQVKCYLTRNGNSDGGCGCKRRETTHFGLQEECLALCISVTDPQSTTVLRHVSVQVRILPKEHTMWRIITGVMKDTKILAWLIIMGSGFDDWVYWHFFTITVNYNSSREHAVA
jgi:hypothetical protein